MEIEENDPSSHTKQNKSNCFSDFNNLDLLHYWYYYSQFSSHYYRVQCSVECNDFAPCKSLQLFNNNERQGSKRNLEIVIAQVNTADITITNTENGMNYISTVSPNNSYCIDIQRLSTLKKYMFQRYYIQSMHKENIHSIQHSKFCVSVNNEQSLNQSPENKTNLFHYRKKQYLCNEDSIRKERLNPREMFLLSNVIQENSTDSRLDGQGIDFRISLWKFTLPQLFYTLLQLCNSRFQLTLDDAIVNIFSVHVGYWYFQNISQGYLVKLLLSNINVSTLSVMMHLYFILITHANPNLTIEINYRKKPKLLVVHESLFINTFSFKSVEWCEDHKIVLKSTMFHYPNGYNEEPYSLKLLRAIKYANADDSQIESLIQVVDYEEQTQCEPGENTDAPASHEDKDGMILALSLTEDDNNIIPYESGSEIKVNILSSLPQRPPPLPTPYKKYSDIFRLDNVANFNETSLTGSMENLTFIHKEAEELKKSDIKLLNILFSYDVTNFSFMQNKLWGAELRQKFDALRMYINLHDMFDSHMINESMFESTSVNMYNKYCKPILNQKFVVVTLLNLGKTLGNIMFHMK